MNILKHFWFILLIVGFLFNSSISFSQGKGGKWLFENNGNDEAQWDIFDNNGSLSGSAMFSGSEPKAQGSYYLSIEDSANYGVFTAADHPDLDFKDENLAVSLWYYPVKGFDNPQHLMMKGNRSGNSKTNNYALRINSGYIEFIAHSESGANQAAKSSFKVNDNQWNFIAVLYDKENSNLFMWNKNESVPTDTFDFNASLFPNDDKLYVGTSGENGFKRFWGRIDDLRISNSISDIFDQSTSLPLEEKNFALTFTLRQNYPNPFNPVTKIKYTVETHDGVFVQLRVYDVLGKEKAVLVNEEKFPGIYEVTFDASELTSGIYFYRLTAENFSQTKKMIILR